MMRWRALLAGGILVLAGAALAQRVPDYSAPPVRPNADTRRVEAAVIDLANAIEENFIDPIIARRYAARLRQRVRTGAYGRRGTIWDSLETLNADLRAAHPAAPISVSPTVAPPAVLPPRANRPEPAAIAEAGWRADGVAYIQFRRFSAAAEDLARLDRFMAEHQGARAIIFDLALIRAGEGLAEMDAIFPYLFERPTALIGYERRSANRLAPRPTLRQSPAPLGLVRQVHWALPAGVATPLRTGRLYIILSGSSGAGARNFARALQRTGRVTLIGEPSAARGLPSRDFVFPYFAAFFPIGRTYDPATGRDFDMSEIAVDVAAPSYAAQREALRRAAAP
jgi:hypothetical protein